MYQNIYIFFIYYFLEFLYYLQSQSIPNRPDLHHPPQIFFHIYTIHRCIKSRKILKISGQNTYENYFFYVSRECNFLAFGFLKIPCSDIEFSFKLQNFEKYPSKLPNNTYVYRLLSKDSKNHAYSTQKYRYHAFNDPRTCNRH